jgi:hypothetical protein
MSFFLSLGSFPGRSSTSTSKFMAIGSYVKGSSELQIFVDGFPLRELDIGWLRKKVGFVGQVRSYKLKGILKMANYNPKIFVSDRNPISFIWTSSQTLDMVALDTLNTKI